MDALLMNIAKDEKLREELKPNSMSESRYQTLLIESYNHYDDVQKQYNLFKRRLKAHIMIDSLYSKVSG